ncbi:MAG: CHAD domain-containing protein [Janthinobacterium lividum]
MKKKEAVRQLNSVWKKMKAPLQTFIKLGDQEELHQFRVQVKKLKAMLVLFAAEPDNQVLMEKFKPVKKVFAKAGEIRNAHINLKLGEKYQLNDEDFNLHQQKALDEGTAVFKDEGDKYLKAIKKAHVALQNDLCRLHNKTIHKFYQHKLVKLDDFFVHIAFNEELHDARKNIKLLLYNQRIAADAIQNKIDLNYDYLDELQQNIGEWHDHNLAIEMLSKTRTNEYQAITDLKNSNAELEKVILETGKNFKEKVNAMQKNF